MQKKHFRVIYLQLNKKEDDIQSLKIVSNTCGIERRLELILNFDFKRFICYRSNSGR